MRPPGGRKGERDKSQKIRWNRRTAGGCSQRSQKLSRELEAVCQLVPDPAVKRLLFRPSSGLCH